MRVQFVRFAAAAAWLAATPAHAQRTELKMPVITQQTPVWCWAATASMALKLLGFPDINPAKNYQCGVVAAAFPRCDDDCTQCITSLRSVANLVGVLNRYSDLSLGSGKGVPDLFSPNYVAHPGWDHIKHSVDLSYPVIAGISPDSKPDDPGATQHTVLITGYDDNYRGTGQRWVIVRDPYPYAQGRSPYRSAGYRYDAASGKAELPWRVLRDRLNLTSAVFLEGRSA